MYTYLLSLILDERLDSILYSDCQIHFSASTKQSVQIHYLDIRYREYWMTAKQMLRNTDAVPRAIILIWHLKESSENVYTVVLSVHTVHSF